MTTFLSSSFMHNIFGGLAQGVIYSLVALSLVIIWQSTHVLNFAQGAMAMFATYIGMTEIDRGVGYWWCVIISVVVGMALGGATERVLIRPLYGKPEINPIVVMVGFLGVLEALAAAIWTSTTRNITEPFSQIYFQSNGHLVFLSSFVIFQILLAIGIMLFMAGLFRFTKLGLQLRASALAPEVSRLLGVRVSRMLTIGWILSAGVGAIAAVIIASGSFGLFPTNMDGIFVAGFIAAAVGGLESPIGAVAGGLTIGLAEQFILAYWSPNVAPLGGIIILVIALMIRPQGLFTKNSSRRV
ncbi:MAG TPA: branched-chain amino acid ABC transporter permease [Acidimicrobiales bacterium]|nr:branched-chain amino acid ABC transporter permease [Acidimicrobiales bacterium]